MENEIIYPFQSELFFEKWNQWKAYKKEQFRFVFKGVHSEQAQLMRLAQLAEGNEQSAIDHINFAMGQTWRGLYPIPERERQKPKSMFQQLTEMQNGK